MSSLDRGKLSLNLSVCLLESVHHVTTPLFINKRWVEGVLLTNIYF